jgi:hypothetical protein
LGEQGRIVQTLPYAQACDANSMLTFQIHPALSSSHIARKCIRVVAIFLTECRSAVYAVAHNAPSSQWDLTPWGLFMTAMLLLRFYL